MSNVGGSGEKNVKGEWPYNERGGFVYRRWDSNLLHTICKKFENLPLKSYVSLKHG